VAGKKGARPDWVFISQVVFYNKRKGPDNKEAEKKKKKARGKRTGIKGGKPGGHKGVGAIAKPIHGKKSRQGG